MKIRNLILSICTLIAIWSCNKDDGPYPLNRPSITSFSPESGPAGTVITINGVNFSETAANNTVLIGTTEATVTSASDTKLIATVTEGSVTGEVSVVVNGKTAMGNIFTVTEPEPENQAPVIDAQVFEVIETISDIEEIGTVTASDPDQDDLTFTISANDNDLFEITETGVLSLADGKQLDFENIAQHIITVMVSDGTDQVEATMTINVLDDTSAADPSNFVTTWKTTQNNEAIVITLNNVYDYNFTVDWGDGTVEQYNMPNGLFFQHLYENPGTYAIAIQGTFPAINMKDNPTPEKLMGIERWGNIQWQTMEGAFTGSENMEYHATDAPDLSNVTSMKEMFTSCKSFNGDLNNWNTSNITDMTSTFHFATSFNGNIADWDTGNVTIMALMFDNASSFNGDLSKWDTSKVTDMDKMFQLAINFTGDISNWNTSNVTNMAFMFSYATNFNGNISSWETSKVLYMNWMFAGAESFNGSIGNWDTGMVITTSRMFEGASSFDQDLGGWDIGSIQLMPAMFDDSGMGPSNMSNTLIGWSDFTDQNNGPKNITLGMHNITYCGTDAGNAILNLAASHNWSFEGTITHNLNCN